MTIALNSRYQIQEITTFEGQRLYRVNEVITQSGLYLTLPQLFEHKSNAEKLIERLVKKELLGE